MTSNTQLELAYQFVQYTSKNLFLTGKAGTGKTTFLQTLKKNAIKRMTIVAPTGVAAINAGGVTIHSFFQLPFGPFIPGETNRPAERKFNKDKINLIRALDLLVIDEISMVRADMLDAIDDVLRKYRDRSKPFGGLQLLMIGDLQQLAPIVKEDEWLLLKPHYDNVYFFESKALQLSMPVTIELRHIYRQSDEQFISLLNSIRENKLDPTSLDALNTRYIPGFKPDDHEGYITLTTHNYSAQKINQSKLHELNTKSYLFDAKIENDFPEYAYPNEAKLELKIDAQVMFIKNDPSRDKIYYNGKIGRVSRFEEEIIYVQCPGETGEIAVAPVEWQNIKYHLGTDKQITEEIVGTYTQYPLKLAWAITIHKSQGLTFEKAIIDAASSFAHGQVYVAFSRCKSLEGLVLSSPINLNSVRTDPSISVYSQNVNRNQPTEDFLIREKRALQVHLIRELFDFKPIKNKLSWLKKNIEGDIDKLSPGTDTLITSIQIDLETQIINIVEKFDTQLKEYLSQTAMPEENNLLQDRISKAVVYFDTNLETKLYKPLSDLIIASDNKTIKKQIQSIKEESLKEIFIKRKGLQSAFQKFSVVSYMQSRVNAEMDFQWKEKGEPLKIKKYDLPLRENISIESDAPLHMELYDTIKNWRDHLASETNLQTYMVLPQKTIKDLATYLPRTASELVKINGIGKAKLVQYGTEIMEMIDDYCKVHQINTVTPLIPLKTNAREKRDPTTLIKKEPSHVISYRLFTEGNTMAEIAQKQNVTLSTITQHLTKYIEDGKLNIDELVSQEAIQAITSYIKTHGLGLFAEMHKGMLGKYSYDEIRMVVKSLHLPESKKEEG